MCIHESKCSLDIWQMCLLITAWHHIHKCFLPEIIMIEREHEILSVIIEHSICQLVILTFSEQRVSSHEFKKILSPAVILLISKHKRVIIICRSNSKPAAWFFCYCKTAIATFSNIFVHSLKKFDCVKILIAAIHVRCPCAWLLTIIEVKHWSNTVNSDAVNMVIIKPH